MKALILITSLLAVAFATDNIDIKNEKNVNTDVHQTVNIDNHDNVANVNQYNGWDSWNTMWDYNRGVFAVRLLSKKACVVSRINRNVVPSLEHLNKASQEKQKANAPPPPSMTYTVTKNRVRNVAQFGKHIAALCNNIPTYHATEVQDPSLYETDCIKNSIINIMGIVICGLTPNCQKLQL
ncbi:gastrokine-1 isoform X1 [Xenopus laevis]|uniref:Gastrokine-1 isoform X1 n=1 Tax=Xenopus laevis TaxID=8355 RepID=A0A8J1MMD9_XENLA|nr:gastrokine-1 isoform X1 [Xenopus laevis]